MGAAVICNDAHAKRHLGRTEHANSPLTDVQRVGYKHEVAKSDVDIPCNLGTHGAQVQVDGPSAPA